MIISQSSFDIDGSLKRFWEIVEGQSLVYKIAEIGNTAKFKSRDYDFWQKSWFPACTNVFCYEKN